LGRLADLGVKRTAADLDPLRGKLEAIFERELSGKTPKTKTRGFGVGDSQLGKQSVSADGTSPATDATRTATTGANARRISFTDAELAGTRGRSNASQTGAELQGTGGAGSAIGIGQVAPAQPAAKAQAKLTWHSPNFIDTLHNAI